MVLSESELTAAIEAALRAANAAAVLINKCIEERNALALDIQSKSSSVDLVTQYDKQAEDEVLEILRTATPHYEILSEESHSGTQLSRHPTWVVDPIDGTTSFIHGLFDCCVSIALVVDKEPILGVVSAPRLQEVFSAVKGRGAFRNGQRIAASGCTDIHKAVASIHQPYNRSPNAVKSTIGIQAELARKPIHAVRCYGSAALDMCSVACGRLDLYFEVGIYGWDVSAGDIIIREAGGVVSNIDGSSPLDIMSRGVVCASSDEIANEAVELAARHDYYSQTLNATSDL